jgi:CheY-like chemotaxis protein
LNRSPHALIVEDLEFWQDVLSEVLIDAGYRTWIASSYAQAMDALAQAEFDVAVLDPVLDDTNRRNRDGLRVLQYLLNQRPEIGAVVVTSSDPNRIQREVRGLSPDVPLLWKDEWNDDIFLSMLNSVSRATRTGVHTSEV